MPGRPKRMAKIIADLEEQALVLSGDVFLAAPRQYLERPDDAPLCKAWNMAVEAAMTASVALEQLGDRLRIRAGVTDPGPCEQFCSESPDGDKPRPSGTDSGGGAIDMTENA